MINPLHRSKLSNIMVVFFQQAPMRDLLARHPRVIGIVCSLLVHVVVALGLLGWISAPMPSNGFGHGYSEGEVSISLTSPSHDLPSQLAAQQNHASAKAVLAPSSMIRPIQSDEDAKAGAAADAAAKGDSYTIVDASAAGDGAASDYRERLIAYLEQFRQYPRASRSAGHQGTVYLLFELERNGEVKGTWVARSSGYTDLDEAALDTVRQAGRLPPIPSELPNPLMIPLPIVFSLGAEGAVRR